MRYVIWQPSRLMSWKNRTRASPADRQGSPISAPLPGDGQVRLADLRRAEQDEEQSFLALL